MICKIEIDNDWAIRLMGSVIRTALEDLYKVNVTEDDAPAKTRDKARWAKVKNNEIEANRESAREFFDSELYESLNISVEVLKDMYEKIEAQREIKVKDLARQSGKTEQAVYVLARKLGRIPTLEEVMSQKRGRPPKK